MKKAAINPAESHAPITGGDLAKVWKAWTGVEPSKLIRFQIEATGPDAHGIPSEVAILGRLSRLIESNGNLVEFPRSSGPLMVTDAAASGVWFISDRGHEFNLRPSVICYIAEKPKFGDREPVEYVHGFDGPTRARMTGQVGRLTGSFTVTPRGLEG